MSCFKQSARSSPDSARSPSQVCVRQVHSAHAQVAKVHTVQVRLMQLREALVRANQPHAIFAAGRGDHVHIAQLTNGAAICREGLLKLHRIKAN
jgi:hypothetical protein